LDEAENVRSISMNFLRILSFELDYRIHPSTPLISLAGNVIRQHEHVLAKQKKKKIHETTKIDQMMTQISEKSSSLRKAMINLVKVALVTVATRLEEHHL
jgi:hypothetical protein